MTQVITRFFDTEAGAKKVRRQLVRKGMPPHDVRVLSDRASVADSLSAESVDAGAVAAYKSKMGSGGAVLLAKATYIPLGAPSLVREMTAAMGAVDLGDIVEEVHVKDVIEAGSSILRSHPKFFTKERDLEDTNYHMANWPIPLITRWKSPNYSLIEPHARMANWPIPLTMRRKPSDQFAFPRHARMANFPIPLTSRRKPRDAFVFPRHARMANFPIPLISRRKPFTGTIIGRHTRMANWPFPHLINGTSDNAIIPNGPRMANFPIPLISKRKPINAFAFPRHARMANFPIPLKSDRKPMTASIFPRHARMANVFLPLVVKHGSSNEGGFSFSKVFGLSTLKDRAS